jgi:hypothetical protein
MYPFIKNKKRWPLKPDVMYDSEWPMRHVSLLFAGRALRRPEYLELWKTLPADSKVDEVIRNFFIRQPVLWQSHKPARTQRRREEFSEDLDETNTRCVFSLPFVSG